MTDDDVTNHHPDCRIGGHPVGEHCRDESDWTCSCLTPGCDRPHLHRGHCSVEGAPLA